MSSAPNRPPDHRGSRFFISPILGCSARCSFCYIHSFDYRQPRGVRNLYGVAASLDWIQGHANFRPGRTGSIISIGAWGDPFPFDDPLAKSYSLDWLEAACKTGNPVQIMSRFGLDLMTVGRIIEGQRFDRQVLFSSSLSTVKQWKQIERYSSPPAERLRTLQLLAAGGVQTSLMIKPFLPGITDRESFVIAELMIEHDLRLCVIGDFFYDDKIMRTNDAVSGMPVEQMLKLSSANIGNPLDCSSESEFVTVESTQIPNFIRDLWRAGIAAFRKSACVNAWILQQDMDLKRLPELAGHCVECGLCNT